MSIKLMSAIFETEFRDLPYTKDGEVRKAKASTAKLLLLAIADHANDYGESAYPGYDKLETKTALSRQGIADTLIALKQNGLLLISDKPSRLGTNDYSINIDSFPGKYESSHLTSVSQATLPAGVKPLDLNHQLTIKDKPSKKRAASPKAPRPPELNLFREVVKRNPPSVNYDDVIASIQKVAARLLRPITKDDLLPFYKAWCHKGYNPVNLAWLEWAETGQIPKNGTWKPRNTNFDNNMAILQAFAEKG